MLPLVDTPALQVFAWTLFTAAMLLAGWRLWTVLRRETMQQKSLVDAIDSLLPQTQCGQCGYAGCRPYARALAAGEAVNKCAPGGSPTLVALSELMNVPLRALDPAHGTFGPRQVAVIREAECIGCTKCIDACPVDAIIGGPKLMHTVIASECTGCDLCIEPCPVDCIDLLDVSPQPRRYWPLPSQVPGPAAVLERGA